MSGATPVGTSMLDVTAASTPVQRAFLSACCRALMALDNPADLTPGEREALVEFTDELAQAHGYDGWIDAAHKCKE